MRTCSRCKQQSGSRASDCVHCGQPFPEPKQAMLLRTIRKCGACGAEGKPNAQYCECGERLPLTYANRHTQRTPTGQKRYEARKRMLDSMRGPACICGLHGYHECTRTAEWRGDLLAFLSARQQ